MDEDQRRIGACASSGFSDRLQIRDVCAIQTLILLSSLDALFLDRKRVMKTKKLLLSSISNSEGLAHVQLLWFPAIGQLPVEVEEELRQG
ncbi:hypothetical protein MUK42_12833 [Musa troglodytarum]|uniref:Uncharacterized protein n=1 Tax=Musa troglodytarum TaxID=320322 RepID=A0A9E7L145_9LILI|nr:hypothetical protein MUK42_12833 [Musa troglodytarum]